MNSDSKGQQIEFDVFAKQEKSDYSYLSGIKEDATRNSSAVNLILSSQSIIILFICVFMLLIASFALGVEKGKLSANSLPALTQAGTGSEAAASGAVPAAVTAKNAPENQRFAAPNTELQLQKLQNAPQTASAVTETDNASVAVQTENSASGYCIQIASLKGDNAAKNLAQTLTKKGFTAFTRSSGKYLTVLVGGFANKQEAQVKLKELKKTYPDCYIRKI